MPMKGVRPPWLESNQCVLCGRHQEGRCKSPGQQLTQAAVAIAEQTAKGTRPKAPEAGDEWGGCQ